jgi:hypothetical protein
MRCLSMTDDSKLVRDVIYTRRKEGRPVDAFIRLQVADRWIGSGYLHVQDGAMDVIADGAETGHSVQRLAVPEDFFSIATHAVMLDGWMYFNYDRLTGGEQQRVFYNTSTRLDGADGPLGRVETCRVKMIGEEEVEVPAGRFKAMRFQMDSDNLEFPASSLWVAGEDKILLRCDWHELDLEYVLTAWKVEHS